MVRAAVVLALLLGALLPPARVSAAPKPRGISVYSRRDTKSTRALIELLTFEECSKPKQYKSAKSVARSKAEVVVVSLDTRGNADREDLDKATISALRKRKLIGIDDGAARLFGRLGFHIRRGKCASGISGAPSIILCKNELLDLEAHDPTIKVFEPPVLDSKNFHNDLIFGLHAPRGGELERTVELIARFSGGDYAPIAREGKAVLICVTAPVQHWSQDFRRVVRDLTIGLHGKLQREVTRNVVRGEAMQGGLRVSVSMPAKATVGEPVELQVRLVNESANAVNCVRASSHHLSEIVVTTDNDEPVPLTRFGRAGRDEKTELKLLKSKRTLEESVNLARIVDLSVAGRYRVIVRLTAKVGEEDRKLLEVKDLELTIVDAKSE